MSGGGGPATLLSLLLLISPFPVTVAFQAPSALVETPEFWKTIVNQKQEEEKEALSWNEILTADLSGTRIFTIGYNHGHSYYYY